MEPIYQTGNDTVDRLSRIRFTGNVIPPAWYRTILRDTGKPYLIAIVILSELCTGTAQPKCGMKGADSFWVTASGLRLTCCREVTSR